MFLNITFLKEIFIFIIFFSEKCTSGFYGHNCLDACGHCLGTSACDPVNGRCTNGCAPGWQQTAKCDISRWYFTIDISISNFINVSIIHFLRKQIACQTLRGSIIFGHLL